MTSQKLTLIVGVLTVSLVVAGSQVTDHLNKGICDRGSPELASEWKSLLAPLNDPDDAKQKYPDIQVWRFGNEWLMGFSQDSHGLWRRGGGTLVIKDSLGKTRVYFGHVCGPEFGGFCQGAGSLSEFYRLLIMSSFVEQVNLE
jgi:hypothetical protein